MKFVPDVVVSMRDGVDLMADVLLPDGEGPFPALLQRVAYDRGNPGIRDGALDVWKAVRRGYAVITEDCRGRFASGGDFVPFVNEADDGVDTIAWIREQPWSDGTVGMFGRSYSALLQWQTAARRPEGLRAIVPMFSGVDPVTDWFGSGRSLEWGFLGLWGLGTLASDAVRRTGDSEAAAAVARIGAAIDEVLAEAGDSPDVAAVRAVLPWLDEWLDDDRREGAFGRISAASASAEAVETPALVIAGWFDLFLPGTLRAFAAEAEGATGPRNRRELVVGPWPHGGNNPGVFPEFSFGPAASGAAAGLTERQLDWFDRWLRGREVGATARATWFHRGRGWRHGTSWPPVDATTACWYLDADRAIVDDVPATTELALGFDTRTPVPTIGGATFLPGLEVAANAGPRDQHVLLDRADVLSWTSAELTADLDVVGEAACELELSAAAGSRVVARLVEVMADGRAMLVTDGNAVVAVSGRSHLSVALGPLAWTFVTGSRVGLLLSNGSLPRHRRWPGDRRDGAVELQGVLAIVTGRGTELRLGGTQA
jgi:putative CocE/NonD family hydrolase